MDIHRMGQLALLRQDELLAEAEAERLRRAAPGGSPVRLAVDRALVALGLRLVALGTRAQGVTSALGSGGMAPGDQRRVTSAGTSRACGR